MDIVNSLTNNRTWSRHGIKIVWAIATLVLLLVIAFIGYAEYTNRLAKKADYAPQNLPPIAGATGPKYRVTDITSANLFGDPRPKEVVTKNIPKTTLNLKLVGVLWATDQQLARVIIQSGNKKANLYGIGENIEGAGASVKEIHSNEILLSRNGATEKLPLFKKKGGENIISYETASFNDTQQATNSYRERNSNISRSTRKPISPNGENRKIRKPNFSGLDRALEKMGEI